MISTKTMTSMPIYSLHWLSAGEVADTEVENVTGCSRVLEVVVNRPSDVGADPELDSREPCWEVVTVTSVASVTDPEIIIMLTVVIGEKVPEAEMGKVMGGPVMLSVGGGPNVSFSKEVKDIVIQLGVGEIGLEYEVTVIIVVAADVVYVLIAAVSEMLELGELVTRVADEGCERVVVVKLAGVLELGDASVPTGVSEDGSSVTTAVEVGTLEFEHIEEETGGDGGVDTEEDIKADMEPETEVIIDVVNVDKVVEVKVEETSVGEAPVMDVTTVVEVIMLPLAVDDRDALGILAEFELGDEVDCETTIVTKLEVEVNSTL